MMSDDLYGTDSFGGGGSGSSKRRKKRSRSTTRSKGHSSGGSHGLVTGANPADPMGPVKNFNSARGSGLASTMRGGGGGISGVSTGVRDHPMQTYSPPRINF